MEQRCSFSLGIVCCFLLLISPATINPAGATPFIDLINSTCTQCAQNSAVFNYDFCVTSLQAVPITHVANLEGIAVVAVELALQNATSTVSTIEKMLAAGAAASDPFSVRCLKDCLELYADAIVILVDSFWEFFSRHYNTANILLSAVMETASTCEEGFAENVGEMAVAPLTEENDDLFRLSDIALCITKLVSRDQISGGVSS